MPQTRTLPGRATLASPDLAQVVESHWTGKIQKAAGADASPPPPTQPGHAVGILDRQKLRTTASLGRAEDSTDPLQTCPTVARGL